MKCDLCDAPAVVHEVTVKSGMTKEVHLCEKHAQQAGIVVPQHHLTKKMLAQVVVASASAQSKGKKATKKLTCPTCGMNLAEFRQTGLLGCPDCYHAFEDQLSRLIERSQNGGTCHTGKAPKRLGTSAVDRQAQVRRLLKELDDAVAAEQYERAAKLRDQLRSIEVNGKPDGERKPIVSSDDALES